MAAEVLATTRQVTTTLVEWPREKKVPTSAEGRPEAWRRRTVMSIAEMWSASRAWRRPKVQERMALVRRVLVWSEEDGHWVRGAYGWKCCEEGQ